MLPFSKRMNLLYFSHRDVIERHRSCLPERLNWHFLQKRHNLACRYCFKLEASSWQHSWLLFLIHRNFSYAGDVVLWTPVLSSFSGKHTDLCLLPAERFVWLGICSVPSWSKLLLPLLSMSVVSVIIWSHQTTYKLMKYMKRKLFVSMKLDSLARLSKGKLLLGRVTWAWERELKDWQDVSNVERFHT